MNGASSTLRNATTVLGARKTNQLANCPKQGHLWIGINGICLVVNFECNRSHGEKFFIDSIQVREIFNEGEGLCCSDRDFYANDLFILRTTLDELVF